MHRQDYGDTSPRSGKCSRPAGALAHLGKPRAGLGCPSRPAVEIKIKISPSSVVVWQSEELSATGLWIGVLWPMLLVPKCLNGIEIGGSGGRVQPEHDPDEHADPHRKHHGVKRHDGRNAR